MKKKLKELILKKVANTGIDVDGDIVTIFDKKYYVHENNKDVREVK